MNTDITQKQLHDAFGIKYPSGFILKLGDPLRYPMNPITDDTPPHTDDYYIQCVGGDPLRLDLPFVVNNLLNSYWGGWRSHDIVTESIRNSICFGLWKHAAANKNHDEQVGFARVVTDYATFSWLADVFIAPAHQKKGLGRFFLNTLIAHDSIARRACYLSTRDAHEFYAKFGFMRQGDSNVMRRLPI